MTDEIFLPGPTALVVTLAVAAVAAWYDMRSYRIPNWLTLPYLMSGLAYNCVTGGFVGLQTSLLGAGVGFAILFALYCLGAMGGGDVKLLAGIGAWLGGLPAAMVFIMAAVAHVLYCLWVLARRGELRRAFGTIHIAIRQVLAVGRHLGNGDVFEANPTDPKSRHRFVPFGLMLAVGVVCVAIIAGLIGS